MPKQTYNINGTKVRADNPEAAAALASEVSGQPKPISVTGLQNPVQPMKITPQAPATGTDSTLGYLGSLSTQAADTYTKQAEAQQGTLSDLQSQIGSLLQAPGETALTATAYDTGGVNTAEAELKDINSQLLAEQHSLERQLQEAAKNPNGLFGGALQQNLQDIKDASLRRQADLSVIALAKQGKFDSAKAIADRAVDALTEAKQNKLNTLKFLYDQHKDLFDKNESRAFEIAQKQREGDLAFERQKLMQQYEFGIFKEKTAYEQKLKQNDPLYQAQLAQIPLENSYKRAQIANVYSEITARSAATGNTGTLTGKPQTQAQVTVQGYADRTLEADKIITAAGSKFTGVSSYLGQTLPNFLKTATRQQYEQAQRNFVNAVLRRESGAVISDEEFANARQQYFPQPGDKPEVVAQKANNRNTVINNLYQGANTYRPTAPGTVIEDADGKKYMIGEDGETLTPL